MEKEKLVGTFEKALVYSSRCKRSLSSAAIRLACSREKAAVRKVTHNERRSLIVVRVKTKGTRGPTGDTRK
jgi:hypothetical protein